jgi:hypothetical protein
MSDGKADFVSLGSLSRCFGIPIPDVYTWLTKQGFEIKRFPVASSVIPNAHKEGLTIVEAEQAVTRRRALGFRAKEFEVAGNEDLAVAEAEMRKATELIREGEAQMDAELHRIDRYAIPEEQKQELRETIFERQRERIQAQREIEVAELLQPGLKQARKYDMSLKAVIEIVLNYFD